jgi:hypothetical protein
LTPGLDGDQTEGCDQGEGQAAPDVLVDRVHG